MPAPLALPASCFREVCRDLKGGSEGLRLGCLAKVASRRQNLNALWLGSSSCLNSSALRFALIHFNQIFVLPYSMAEAEAVGSACQNEQKCISIVIRFSSIAAFGWSSDVKWQLMTPMGRSSIA